MKFVTGNSMSLVFRSICVPAEITRNQRNYKALQMACYQPLPSQQHWYVLWFWLPVQAMTTDRYDIRINGSHFFFFSLIRLAVLQEIACFLRMTGTCFCMLSTSVFLVFSYSLLPKMFYLQDINGLLCIATTNQYSAQPGFLWVS